MGNTEGDSIMRVLAFDPGKTTGWAEVWSPGEEIDSSYKGVISTPYGDVVEHGSFPNWSTVEDLLTARSPDAVVYERFFIYPHKAASLQFDDVIAAQVIGVIRFLCKKLDVPIYRQTASEMKTHVVRMKHISSFAPDHEYDAACHGVIWMFKHNRNG